MNELTASHQNIISQKDKQLADFKKQVDTLQKAETELTKQIEEQKGKNNVSSANIFLQRKKTIPVTLPSIIKLNDF